MLNLISLELINKSTIKIPNWKINFPVRDFSFFRKKVWVYIPNNILPKYNTMKIVTSKLFKIRHISMSFVLETKNGTFEIGKIGTKNYLNPHRQPIADSLQ